MEHPTSFGYWLRRRRKALDLTQDELARLVGCSLGTIKSIESDERRPSKQLAARLADCLRLSAQERDVFVQAARMQLHVDRLPSADAAATLGPLRHASTEADIVSTNEARPSDMTDVACPVCGAAALAAQRFCSQCGTLLRQSCRACGAESVLGVRFCTSCGATFQSGQAPAELRLGHSPTSPKEERRWVTVLFADLADFTALSEQLDIEDVKALVSRWIEHASEQIRSFGGIVVNVMGDGILAVFGAPIAHEDDAVRAVRAAITLRESTLRTSAAVPLVVHVGVNTGEALATVYGPPEHRHYTVLGDVVNTAHRIVSAAVGGSVFVGEETYLATRKAVHYHELEPIDAKGKEHPVRVWEALSFAVFPEDRPRGTAPLIGRDDELALLDVLWSRVVREQQPHLVTVLGEPGIGKSRLSAEFVAHLGAGVRVLHGRCLPYDTTLSYGPLAAMLRDAARISADDGRETAREKLRALVVQVIGQPQHNHDEIALHLALLSGLDTAADRRATAGDQKTLHASARRFFEAFARKEPLCLVFEDIHWADATLLDLIELIAGRTRVAPLLILTQARSELLERRAGWGGGVPGVTTLPLSLLSERAEQELVLTLCRERQLPELTAIEIGRGPNGNPLFAEELVAMAAEQRRLSGVPTAIKTLIGARIDTLPDGERDLLQLAAVFGKAFWASGLHTLAGGSLDIADRLDALEAKDLIRSQPRSQFLDSREYNFKHDLIRDVIYDMLPKATRRTLHEQVVTWMEHAARGQVDQYLDQLAHHALHAGHRAQAVDYLTRAAERATHAADHRHAATLFQQAITLASELGLRALVADLHARRGKAFVSISRWVDARPELEMALAELPAEQDAQRAMVLIDLATVCFWVHDIPVLRRSALEAMDLAERLGRDDIAAGALAALALVHSSDGEPQRVEHVVAQSLERAGEQPIAAVTFGVAIQSFNLYWLGRFDAALVSARHAVEIARGMKDTQFISYSLPHAGLALAAQGAYADAERLFREAQQYCRDYEIWPNLARAIAISAGYHLDIFDYAGHEVIAEEARELAGSANLLNPLVSASLDLLFNYVRRGDVGRAERIIADVAETVERAAGAHGWLWRLRLIEARAELALARGDWEESVRLADSAIVECQVRGRVKYESFGRETRARALAALGRHNEAIAEARSNMALVRPLGAPALFLRAAATQLSLAGDDVLFEAAQAAAREISAALPTESLRRTFDASELVRSLKHPH
jgi:class 3 adenylate cyclase/transcriptional regulator with XRE-family HTH domain/tetratricopeptide (TPR) repeat protein